MAETPQSNESFALVARGAPLIFLLVCGCTLATEALRSVGIPIGPGVTAAAGAVDAAVRGWFDALIWGGLGVAGVGGACAAHRVVKRRREKKKAAPTP
jgi:hypothetical protein